MTSTGTVVSLRSGPEAISAEAYRAQRADTLADAAYRQIEGLYVDGTLPPGSFVSEPQLHRLTGLGRAPVREAVKRLEAERLLLPMHRKGIYVPPIEIGEHLRLPLEARLVPILLVAQDLHRDVGARRVIACAEHDAHRPRPDELTQLEPIRYDVAWLHP